MIGLGSSIAKPGKIGKRIVRDGLVLKHDYNAGSVEPCSTGAVFVDGTDDYINTGSTFQSTFRDSFSICTWVKPVDGQGSEVTVLGTLSANAEDGVRIDILTGGEVRFVFEGNNDQHYRTTSSEVFSNRVNDWTHIACVATKVGSGSDETEIVIYINGVSVATTPVEATTAANHALYTSDINLTLGCRLDNTTPGRFFDGYMCNTGIWGAALTQPQVKSIMHKDYAALSTSEKTSLVSWWNLDSTIPDVSTEVYDNHYAGSSELGSELITNGSFDGGGASWSENLGWTIAGGVGSWDIATSTQNHHISQTITALVVGAVYKLTFTISNNTSGRQSVRLQTTGADPASYQDVFPGGYTLHANGEHTMYFKATGARTDFRFAGRDETGGAAGNFSVDDISLKLVNGNHGTLS